MSNEHRCIAHCANNGAARCDASIATAPATLLLGDAIEKGLARFGINKERIAKWFGGCFGCGLHQ